MSHNDSINSITPDQWNTLRNKYPAIEPSDKTNNQPIVPFKLPVDAKLRKAIPIYTGFINYFPRAIAAVAKVSLEGGIQHGQTPETLHWDRPKSGDELDAMMRHVIDKDWAQVAWRALAHLEKHLERKETNQ